MKNAWKFDFNQGLFMTFEIYTCMSYPLLKNLQRGHPSNYRFFVYFSRLHRIIPTIYFAGVLVMISTAMHFWYRLELQSSGRKLYINVHFSTPAKNFSSKNGKKILKNLKIIKLERCSNYKNAGYFHMIHPRQAIEVKAEFPDMNYKGRPQNSLKASVPSFQPSISADYGTLTKPHICNRIKEFDVVQCRTAITEGGYRMHTCLGGKFIYFKNATPTNSWWWIIRYEIRDRFVDLDKTRFYTPRQKVQR